VQAVVALRGVTSSGSAGSARPNSDREEARRWVHRELVVARLAAATDNSNEQRRQHVDTSSSRVAQGEGPNQSKNSQIAHKLGQFA